MVGPPCIIAPFPNPALPFIHLQVNALEHVQGSAAAWEGVMSSLIRCFLVSRMEKHWQQEYDKDSRKYVPHRRESLLSCTSMRHMRLANLLTCTCDTCPALWSIDKLCYASAVGLASCSTSAARPREDDMERKATRESVQT